jgi:hypothetical protein
VASKRSEVLVKYEITEPEPEIINFSQENLDQASEDDLGLF